MLYNKIATNKTTEIYYCQVIGDYWTTSYRSLPMCLFVITDNKGTELPRGEVHIITNVDYLIFGAYSIHRGFCWYAPSFDYNKIISLSPLTEYIQWYNSFIETIKD